LEVSELHDIVTVLAREYGYYEEWWKGHTPFETLVSIILSQRTYWKNVNVAMQRFSRRFGAVSEVAGASVEEIEAVIKPAGFYRTKAPRIKNIAWNIAMKHGGQLDDITKLSYEEARRELISLEGIGPKTADVLLMALNGEPVLPVDVHIFRIMRRLGVADKRDGYECLRAKLESQIPPTQRKVAHMALIEFGRKVCRARHPVCIECPISDYCHNGGERS